MMLSIRLFLLWIIVCRRVANALSSPKATSISPALLSKIQAAMTTTTESQSNIAKAYDACDLWDDIPMGDLPNSVRAVSSVLHAACLARVGRDSEAEEVYQLCLVNQANYLELKTLHDAKIGRASALQRLMRYDEAKEQFLDASGTLEAVTCCMRLGEVEQANRILKERIQQGSSSKEVRAMLTVMKTLQGNPMDGAALGVLQAAASESPLFQWLTSVVTNPPTSASSDQKQYMNGYDILQIAAINRCPLDDPLLIHLDDKIKLHRLLDNEQFCSWPKGFILPDQLDSFRQHVDVHQSSAGNRSTNKDWILKSRAGYGSHGNQIASASDVESIFAGKATAPPPMESRLCQRLVDPPLLLDGRKFSMRVYVYYFGSNSSSIYLCNKGLVKLASEVYRDDENDDDRMHMTNSGREDVMLQYDFEYLREIFEEAGWSYDDFWNKVREAVIVTMRCYQCDCNETQKQEVDSLSYRKELAKLGIPKILGFDFMATDSLEPMLLEVNRFPGLEARGDGDDEVKRTVVREAWVCAADRMGLTAASIGNAPEITMPVASSRMDEEMSYECLTI